MNKLILIESELVSLIVSTIKDAQKQLFEQNHSYLYDSDDSGFHGKTTRFKNGNEYIWYPSGHKYAGTERGVTTDNLIFKESISEYDNRLAQWRVSSDFITKYANKCSWTQLKTLRGIHQYLADQKKEGVPQNKNISVTKKELKDMEYALHNTPDDVPYPGAGTIWDPTKGKAIKGKERKHSWFHGCKYMAAIRTGLEETDTDVYGTTEDYSNYCGCNNYFGPNYLSWYESWSLTEFNQNIRAWKCIDNRLQAAGKPKSGYFDKNTSTELVMPEKEYNDDGTDTKFYNDDGTFFIKPNMYATETKDSIERRRKVRTRSTISSSQPTSTTLVADMIHLIEQRCIRRMAYHTLEPPAPRTYKPTSTQGSSKEEVIGSSSGGAGGTYYSSEGTEVQVSDEFANALEKFADALGTGFMNYSFPIATISWLETLLKQGDLYFDLFLTAIEEFTDWCAESGWFCMEVVAGTISLVLTVITIFVGTTLFIDGVIIFAGILTVWALWEQGKRGWAFVVGVLEAFGVFRWIKIFKFGKVTQSDEVVKATIKYFEMGPSVARFNALSPEVQFAIKFTLNNKRTAVRLLDNSPEVVDAVNLMNTIKTFNTFKMLKTTKEWQLLPQLKNIKTWDDFLQWRTFADDIAKYSTKLQYSINLAVKITRWSVLYGLPGLGVYFTYARMEEVFGEKIMAKFDEIIEDYQLSWDVGETRGCVIKAWIWKLNQEPACNQKWVKFLDDWEDASYEGDETTEEKWEQYVNFLLDSGGYSNTGPTINIQEIYPDIKEDLEKYMEANSEKCFEGDEIATYIADCSNTTKAETYASSFDAEEVAEDLLDCLENIDEDDREVEFFKISNSLTAQQKLEVRKEFKDMGECLCDWIEDSWALAHETAVLELWNMWEVDKTEGANIFNNCTCYTSNTKSIVPEKD